MLLNFIRFIFAVYQDVSPIPTAVAYSILALSIYIWVGLYFPGFIAISQVESRFPAKFPAVTYFNHFRLFLPHISGDHIGHCPDEQKSYPIY